MDWIQWAIPVIAVVVWILTSLVNNQQQAKARTSRSARPLPSSEEETAAPKPRRSASDVEKFLEEVRRRRDAEEARKPRPDEEVIAKRRQEAEARRAETRARLESERRKRPVPPPLPEEVLIAKSVPAPLRELVAVPAPPAPPQATPTSPPSAGPIARGTPGVSPALAVVGLLRQPQTAATAILLHEILRPPLSRRPPGSKRR